ncbi:MAG: hydantoinase/oxoprolinase family protein [Candidatus Margulisiibacteriota bacterium]|jgi:hypothetical protein
MRKFRIGIDVGGTFTHAVALDENNFGIAAEAKVPTTHTAKEGVALGVFQSLGIIIKELKLDPAQITRIAHSTTEATNALLEGDFAKVGIIALGTGIAGLQVKKQTNFKMLKLTKQVFVEVESVYLEFTGDLNLAQSVKPVLEMFKNKGVEAVVAVTAFSVDNPELEQKVVDLALAFGLPATATSHISQLYGLKARTKTAIINAAILPKMINTALKTEHAIRSMKIDAPIVVMRSDGGAMLIDEMKKRPLLTLLSGPAAGVSAAINSAKILDGIFLEVGGTSTDISVIINGKPQVRMAEIGEHKIYLNTLDIRTVGVAGGSLPCIQENKILSVGPRSAHIAGFNYCSFAQDIDFNCCKPELRKYKKDVNQYFALKDQEQLYTLTTTCAANYLGLIPEADYAYVKQENLRSAFKVMGDFFREEPKRLAALILEKGAKLLIITISKLIKEKELPKDKVFLIGGGGGASVWLNYLHQKTNYPINLVDYAPVISAIGAALSLIQETIERNLIDPKPQDFVNIRAEAKNRLLVSGAKPETIEVKVEIDRLKGVLRATAIGNQAFTDKQNLDVNELQQKAKSLFCMELKNPVAYETKAYTILKFDGLKKSFFNVIKQKLTPFIIFTKQGLPKYKVSHGIIEETIFSDFYQMLYKLLDKYSNYNDAGKVIPAMVIVTNEKLIDLTGLITLEQIDCLLKEELNGLTFNEKIYLTITIKRE